MPHYINYEFNKRKKPPDWFKKELADKLNIPVCGEYKKINTNS